MSKYYLVPVTTRDIKIKGKTLFEMLHRVDRELYNREIRRVEMTYENPVCKYLQEAGLIDEYNNVTSLMYQSKGIPEKIIIKKDEKGIYEFFSEEEIECDNDNYLEVFRINPTDVKKFVENYSYDRNVLRFIKKGSRKRKMFFKCKNSVKQGK